MPISSRMGVFTSVDILDIMGVLMAGYIYGLLDVLVFDIIGHSIGVIGDSVVH